MLGLTSPPGRGWRRPAEGILQRSGRAPGLLTLCALSLAGLALSTIADADVGSPASGRWSGGAGAGFLASTPDGIEPALAGHIDYFMLPALSVGLLAQYAGVGGNDALVGLSAQAKYWWRIPGTGNSARLVVQGGIGFVRADIEDDDSGVEDTYSSFLIPVGIGVDYAVSNRVALTAELLLEFTALGDNVRAAGRDVDLRTNLMPGFYLGVRF